MRKAGCSHVNVPDFSGSPAPPSIIPRWPTWQGFTAGPGLASKIDAISFAPHRAVLQSSITVKTRCSFWIGRRYRGSKIRAKNSIGSRLVLRARYTCCEDGQRSRTPGSVLSVHAPQKHGETALLRPRSAKATLYECDRALVRLYSHPQMLRPCWPLAG